jgi:hypothetical protein
VAVVLLVLLALCLRLVRLVRLVILLVVARAEEVEVQRLLLQLRVLLVAQVDHMAEAEAEAVRV